MKLHLPLYIWLLCVVLLSACSSHKDFYTVQQLPACSSGKVKLLADFETARMDECLVTGENQFSITLKPENTPINPSPWYAFKLVAERPTTVNIEIKVSGNRDNRYLPKVSHDLKTWRYHPSKYERKKLKLQFDVAQSPIYIAAQEVIDNQYYVDWAKGLIRESLLEHAQLGLSKEGRPIYKLESIANTNEWLVILGRLHPPEVTGALALFPFVETLLSSKELAQQFRQKYNILIIPNLNPDGVAKGNWRHNANGIDLNRDWNKFHQPETHLVHNYLQSLVNQGQKIKFAIDFHSTQHDVFYTMPVDYDVENQYFVKEWLSKLDKAMPEFNVIQKPGNSPGNGVSKQYFADFYKVHAITYEMGDETNRIKIRQIAENAAVTLMSSLLEEN